MKAKAGINLHNKFKFELIGADGCTKQVGEAYNIVTNNYWDRLPDDIGSDKIDTSISLGTGTGTPAVTDTGLFQQIVTKDAESRTDCQPLGSGRYSWSITVTFTENEANDNLTEVGVRNSDYPPALMTHAMITDSEGHTITIEKTDTDRLTVTATFYLTLTFDNSMEWFNWNVNYGGYPSIKSMRNRSEWARTLDSSAEPICFCTGHGNSENTFELLLAKGATNGWPVNCAYNYQSDTHTQRYTRGRINSTDYNMSKTYQIFGFKNRFGCKFLPDHNVFAPITLELKQVAAAGNNGDFNFDIPILMDEVTVYVDEVQQTATAYTWGGKDFNLRQAWASQHGDYLIDSSYVYAYNSSYSGTPVAGVKNRYDPGASEYFAIYDFETPKAVNALRHFQSYAFYFCALYYSSDKENWTLAATTQNAGTGEVTKTFDTITARYWKLVFDALPNDYEFADMQTNYRGAFDFIQPQLHLNTSPAEGAVVKVVAKSEYPIKNSNWIIDQIVMDMQISRGGQT
jgi:hypothetical protein